MMPDNLPTQDNVVEPEEILCGLLNALIDEYEYDFFEQCCKLTLNANRHRSLIEAEDRVGGEEMRKRLFHIAHKLNMVLGLNKQELGWLKEYGADVEDTDDE